MEREMQPTRAHSVAWTEPQPQAQEEHAAAVAATWATSSRSRSHNDAGDLENDDIAAMEWYNSAMNPPHHQDLQNHREETAGDIGFLMQPLDSSSSSFNLDPSNKSCFSSFFNGNNPFDNASDLGPDGGFLNPFPGIQPSNSPVLMGFQPQFDTLELSPNPSSEFTPTLLGAFDGAGSSNALFSNKAKAAGVAPPTLFQKRSLLRQGSGGGVDELGALEITALPPRFSGFPAAAAAELEQKMGKILDGGKLDEGLNYDSDDDVVVEIGGDANSNGAAGGDRKAKKKRMPAKNLMAERRRRKKLNDRLYMLRSVVPKISKMDRASILVDAIDYLKELLQRVNGLQNELDSSPTSSSLPPSASCHPLTPTPPTLPCRVKEELCPSSLPSPKNQSAKVEVRAREGRAVNIHMFCTRKPGLLLSSMRALDNLGLDVQQAVVSCFNGFALDVFRAEQCSEDQDVLPEQIKAVLLDIAGFPGMI